MSSPLLHNVTGVDAPMELLVLPDGVDVPPLTQDRVNEMGTIATELAAVVQHVHDTQESLGNYALEIMGISGIRKRTELLNDLVADGLVNKHEAVIIGELSNILPESIGVTWLSAHGESQNILSWAYANHATGYTRILPTDKLNDEASQTALQKTLSYMKGLETVGTAVASRGKLLLDAQDLQKVSSSEGLGVEFVDVVEDGLVVGKKLASESYGIDQVVKALRVFSNNGHGEGSIYRTLLVVDLFTLAYAIPDDHLADLHDTTDLQSTKDIRMSMITGLMTAIGHPMTMRRYLDPILKAQNHPLNEMAENVALCNEQLSSVEVAQMARALADGLNAASDADIEASQSRKSELGDRYNALQRGLSQDLKLYLEEAPSQSRMLGALSVEAGLVRFENALAEQLKRSVGGKMVRKYFGFVQDLPLHDALNQILTEEQSAAAEQRCAELEQIIGSIDTKYAISGKQIRELEGGKDLRKRLEDWKEPGSQRNIFAEAPAQQLAGLALKPEARTNLANDLRQSEAAWIELNALKKDVRRNGLLASIDTLMEVYEAAAQKQLNDKQLQPLWKLLDDLTAPNPVKETAHAGTDAASKPEVVVDVENINEEFPYIEPIRAFPPEPNIIEINVEDIVNDLRESADGLPRRYAIEWERIQSLIKLHAELSSRGLPVAAVRLSASNWHALPHYALEVKGKGENGKVVAVIESPVYGNATYVIPQADWRDIVSICSKKEARDDFNAAARVHADGKTTDDHRLKLMNDIMNSLKP